MVRARHDARTEKEKGSPRDSSRKMKVAKESGKAGSRGGGKRPASEHEGGRQPRRRGRLGGIEDEDEPAEEPGVARCGPRATSANHQGHLCRLPLLADASPPAYWTRPSKYNIASWQPYTVFSPRPLSEYFVAHVCFF